MALNAVGGGGDSDPLARIEAAAHHTGVMRIVTAVLVLFSLAASASVPVWAQDPGPDESQDHESHVPPIDCPLRKAGVDPAGMQPFEEVARYIEFLEREDRAAWQKPDTVIAALGLAGDETIADVGAGSGYFTFRLAAQVPRGRVVAIDIEPEMVRHVHHRVIRENLSNIEALVASPDDPEVPAEADLVFICDVLHHVQGRQAWLNTLASGMKEGARLVLIEFDEGDLPNGPPADLKISRERMIELATTAGLSLRREMSDLLPYQTFLIFEKVG